MATSIDCNFSHGRKQLTARMLSVILILASAAATHGLAQDPNEITAIRAQLQLLKQQHDNLEKRLDGIQHGAVNQMPMSQEGVKAFSDLEKAKEKGKVQTYHEKTALEAYEDILPESVLKIQDKLHTRLFDYLSKGFEWQGYFRAGAGINSKGGHMDAFQAPGAPAKYRLGNESDTYIETVVNENNWNPNQDGLKINTQIRVAYKTQQSKSEDMENKVVLREMFAGMSGFIEANPSTKVWVGERFYRLPELNINDFWWYDLSGYGGGLENIDLGSGRMHIAYIAFSESASSYWTSTDQGAFDYNTGNGRLAKNNFNVMFSDLYAGAGKFTTWVNGGYMQGGTATNKTGSYRYPRQVGIDCGVMHQVKHNQIRNQLSFQYGYGCNSSLSAAGNMPATDDNSHANIVRATEMYDHQITERLSTEIVGVLQYFNTGADAKADATWASCGLRPVYHFFKHFGIEFEPGIDYVNDRQNDVDSYLFKFTTALRITPAPDFFSRPEFRLFATYAQWGQDFEGNPALGGTAFANQRNGLNFGIQAEHWW
ncbi:MAG: carbohydrate porin [Verrucomicrobia bacterium]|nr:carbohydrate porin [Verrucomicrobiota bacterium]MBU4247199.1 carbohydrate porin [Verrucomicrobiota bacterium]MBU4291370.1 carbohydrate porin [Verrucomicrobiota bacterium]MBU4497694.1 carbohydrate porin [Verrucomicrobiota bacterium]MCG2680666.1 carbohydrate porin [Kiritimatiellia bacterium]